MEKAKITKNKNTQQIYLRTDLNDMDFKQEKIREWHCQSFTELLMNKPKVKILKYNKKL